MGGVMQADFLQKPNNIQKLKVPPHSMEAEQCVIGSMLNDPDSRFIDSAGGFQWRILIEISKKLDFCAHV